MTLLLGYNQVFFHPEVLDFLPISPHILSISGKLHLLSWEILDSSIFVCTKQGGGKLMVMPFEIVEVYVYGFGTFFRNVSYSSGFTFT